MRRAIVGGNFTPIENIQAPLETGKNEFNYSYTLSSNGYKISRQLDTPVNLITYRVWSK
jgi:hypothetical protein